PVGNAEGAGIGVDDQGRAVVNTGGKRIFVTEGDADAAGQIQLVRVRVIDDGHAGGLQVEAEQREAAIGDDVQALQLAVLNHDAMIGAAAPDVAEGGREVEGFWGCCRGKDGNSVPYLVCGRLRPGEATFHEKVLG